MSLKSILKRNDISIRQLSIKSGVPYSTLRDLVSNKTSLEYASCKTVLSIAKALYVSVESLFNDDNFSGNIPTIYTNSKKYYFDYLKNNTNIVLRSYSALDYFGYVSNKNPSSILVYSIYKLKEPYQFVKLRNFSKIDYKSFNGILVSTLDQAINDLLEDNSFSLKEIKEIITNINFENSNLLGNINIKKKNLQKFNKLTKGLIKK